MEFSFIFPNAVAEQLSLLLIHPATLIITQHFPFHYTQPTNNDQNPGISGTIETYYFGRVETCRES